MVIKVILKIFKENNYSRAINIFTLTYAFSDEIKPHRANPLAFRRMYPDKTSEDNAG